MANNIIDFKNFSPKSSDKYLFDTNIWMFLYCPLGNHQIKKQINASKILSYIISVQAEIIITSLIIAEFANAFLRLEFEQWRKLPSNVSGKFKADFFETPLAIQTRKTIESAIRKILKITQRFPDNFHNINFEAIYNIYPHLDFNDAYIAYLAKNNNWNLVTDDKDYEKTDLGLNIIKI